MLYIAYAWLISLFLIACTAKPSNEMEEMTRDVLKSKTGVEIEIKPLPKDTH